MIRSFRFRLAMRATGVVLLGSAVLAVITVVTLKAILDRELDASLLNVAAIQAASLADGPSGAMHFHEWELTPEEAASVSDLVQYAQVWGANGASLLRSQYMISDLEVDPQALARASSGELTWTRQAFEGSPMRALFYPLERLGAAHEAHVLQVAAPLGPRNEMLRRAGVFLLLLSALLAGTTYVGSWWLAGTAVRPIHEVIDQAEEIGGRSLDRRINAYADTLEYRRLVDVLNTMLARLQSAFETQRRFTGDASHELRSPLTAMRGEIELALRRDRTPEEYVQVLQSSLEEVVRLSKISQDLLTLARSDSRTLAPSPEIIRVGDVISSVLDRLRTRTEEKAIEIEVRAPLDFVATLDPGVVSQIIWNLVDNALRHTPEGGTIVVTVLDEGARVGIRVEDTGEGLGAFDAETVFDRFFRGDASRTHDHDPSGTGLGLAIVKVLAESHGGLARAENLGAGGARFTVELLQDPGPPSSA